MRDKRVCKIWVKIWKSTVAIETKGITRTDGAGTGDSSHQHYAYNVHFLSLNWVITTQTDQKDKVVMIPRPIGL